ncbi:MAG TPA: glycosyltransferase [Gemmatimonadaceae bacterium]
MIRRILLLAYFFPPIGGAGAQRNTKLARYLPDFGYELRVITGPGTPGHRWAPVDFTLSGEIEGPVDVHRIPGPEPPWRTGWAGRAERWLRLEWPWQRWWETNAVQLARAVGQDVDLVYCSLAPFATARAAATISKVLRKPLVLDLEDPWALDEMMAYETGLHRRLELRDMQRALSAADAIVMNTPEAERRLVATFPELRAKRITSIVNGYDAADFEGTVPERTDRVLRIVHTGSLHASAQDRSAIRRRVLGGTMGRVHTRSRSLLYLMQALSELIAERPEVAERIEVHLAGRLTASDRALIDKSPLIREHGFLPHLDTIALIRSADLLFLPMHDVAPGQRVAIVPCKTYEYLGSDRPILAAVPDGDARDFLAEAGTAELTRPTDVGAMKAAVLRAISRVERGREPPRANPLLLRQLERASLTADLADFLESLLERRTEDASSRVHEAVE